MVYSWPFKASQQINPDPTTGLPQYVSPRPKGIPTVIVKDGKTYDLEYRMLVRPNHHYYHIDPTDQDSDFLWGWVYHRRAIPFVDYIPSGYQTKMIPAYDYSSFNTKEAARAHLEQQFAESGFQIDKIDFNKFGALVTFHSSSVLRR